jgi:hypothetical protein
MPSERLSMRKIDSRTAGSSWVGAMFHVGSRLGLQGPHAEEMRATVPAGRNWHIAHTLGRRAQNSSGSPILDARRDSCEVTDYTSADRPQTHDGSCTARVG